MTVVGSRRGCHALQDVAGQGLEVGVGLLDGNRMGADGTVGSIPISVGQTSRWGLSIVDGAARDECGNRTILAQSYLRSGDTTSTGYLAAATSPNTEARVSKGILAQLNQELIDDNDNLMDDLASIGEAVLLSMDFDDLVDPGYVFASSGYGSSCGWPCRSSP